METSCDLGGCSGGAVHVSAVRARERSDSLGFSADSVQGGQGRCRTPVLVMLQSRSGAPRSSLGLPAALASEIASECPFRSFVPLKIQRGLVSPG